MPDGYAGETIFAPSTAPGRAGVAVIRVSGRQAGRALSALTGGDGAGGDGTGGGATATDLPAPRLATLRSLRDPKSGEPIDRALVLWFPAPQSFTGEDVAELHLHGGRAVVAAVLAGLGGIPGLRPAEAGEFTRRAFDNGKLDLTAVEGLADLIEADTEAQRRQALRQMEGGLARLTDAWAARLLRVLAHFEAAIDFADEDLPEALDREALDTAAGVASEIRAALADGRRGERLREGLSAVILGAPNAGKSSLMNAIARREAAIVSTVAGTTRDVIEVHLDLGGYPVTLVDTAGLRAGPAGEDEGDNAEAGQWAIEHEGMERARRRAEAADLKLLVFDITGGPGLPPEVLALRDERSLLVLNKMDLGSPEEVAVARRALAGEDGVRGAGCFLVSAETGEGLSDLLAAMIERAGDCFANGMGLAEITRERHRRALEDCCASLEAAAAAALPELVAEELRLAVRSLGRLTGRVDVEDLLDVVFSEFCIGK
ncbi:tRNA uridine-5-carboxymethylaminomethyl(34) synthesis GTPase MnmE [Pelagibius litoralis]|uniref:tRNA modification GTPase MnmE n=1 Tax=Pelagibius litoralis TaxID=374515 RepID=A0A967F2G6_9PROT|nr:tRNA uridine-5-carboxymethylaminomethyl(34) synthesis GTPase MnmE [Pelagibius litoralis]NIA71695.1 tRNA uridine-5-carboxymethylaminomethyl(34) synthesis GTPase MnmE [Pelagibius litoralis]